MNETRNSGDTVESPRLDKGNVRYASEHSLTSVVKSCPSFIEKRRMFSVISDGSDLTPNDIIDTEFVSMMDYFQHAAYYATAPEAMKTEKSALARTSRSRSRLATDTTKVYATTINLDDIRIDHTLSTEESIVDDDGNLSIAPSAFYLPKMTPITKYPPEIFVAIKETETVFLYGLPSVSYDKGTPAANLIEEENEYYQYITVGKGRNRKMVPEETQTDETITQTRHTLATRPQKKNAVTFASMWDMHDTYSKLAQQVSEPPKDEMVLYQSAAPHVLRKKKQVVTSTVVTKTFQDIASTPEYLDAVLLTERVLSSMEYGQAQKTFRGLVKVDLLSLDLTYVYTMKPLWTFECADTDGKPIVTISFNPKNPDILAVAHGKFAYAESFKGLVCIWCTKNPCKPERLYRFKSPLTSVAFSEKNPNWLACGFSNGDVIILDITSYEIKTIAKSKRATNPCFEPIWVTNWQPTEFTGEYLMTTCQDGRINKFINTKTHEFICTPMMRISTVEGTLKGLETAKSCLKVDVPITRYPAVLCLLWCPNTENEYLVGTDEGCVHKCSTHYLNQHIDVFRAHAGPVYSLSISPFMNTLLMTCGADNAIRLWLEEMDDVVMTLMCPAAVYGAAFCPKNATVLISVSGNVLSIWDLRRKVHTPCAEHVFPSYVVLTYISFSASGENLFVGDTLGRIHTFHLEDTPIPPYYQRKLLEQTIKESLCTRPNVLKRLDKIEKFRERKS